MKKKKSKTARPIEAAGGIVMRGRARPLFAVVQLRRQKIWVLPKGKLNRDETALAAAKREAIEETGHDVTVHEFLGSLGYKSGGRPKVVKFWRMQASGRPIAKLMRDVRAVRWLSLTQATATLTHERERLFLEKVGPPATRQTALSRRNARKAETSRRKKTKRGRKRSRRAAAQTKLRSYARPRKRREEAPRRRHVSAPPIVHAGNAGFHSGHARPRRREIVRKLWTWLRR